MADAVIFDIDGTLADCTWRQHHVRKRPPDWDAFFAGVGDDPPHLAVIDMARNMAKCYQILLVSGRPERTRSATQAWLNTYGLGGHALFMRPDNDFRPDHVVKQEILNNIQSTTSSITVRLVVDDRPQVVAMWRRNGLTCLQCRDFDEPRPEKPGELVVMVGPSGAGKSFWLCNNTLDAVGWTDDAVVSSDMLRYQLCGNQLDQSKNDAVFAALHDIVATRLKHGLITVVDATNIRRADRLAVAELARGGPVHYVVVNRPLAWKVEHRGWRPTELLERHEQTFQSQLADILAGDNLPNVTVHNFIRE